jgi:hypothetical protein
MRQRLTCLFVLAILAPGVGACNRGAGVFSQQNARAHVEMLAGTIGSRPVGSEANARARAYIIDQLELFGYDVRVQETDARRPEHGLTARVSNIIGVRQGTRQEAIGLVSHYDSTPDTPGAADDGFGVSVSLEAARVLAARASRQWTLFVLVTDGEEAGLLGAAAIVHDRDVGPRLHAYINVEATGSAGPALLFETGPGNAWLVSPWARHALHPRGASYGIEIYRRLPNDTDFSIFKRQEIPGLNFALVGDSYPYHTARDTPARLSTSALREAGDNVVAIADALETVDITQRSPDDPTFFDVGGTVAVSYGPMFSWIVTAAALVLGVLAWVKVMAAAVRTGGIWRWVLAAIWAAMAAVAVVSAMVGVTWALRTAREVYHPWYARPDRLFALLLMTGILVGWGAARLRAWLPERAHGVRHPVVTWSLTLPVWIALASGALWAAPGAAYLWTWPLLAAGIMLLITPPAKSTAVRIASIVVLAVAATLWVRETIELLRFLVAVLGRMPFITPAFVFAAVMALAGSIVAPPLLAAISTSRPLRRPALATALLLLATVTAAGLAYAAPAYTTEQPLRRHARAVQEAGDASSIWEVASIEPGLDLGPGAPGGWSLQNTAPKASVPLGRFPHPFVFRTSADPFGPAPVDIAAFTLTPLAGGTDLLLTVVPHRPGLTVAFVLPAGVTPARSSLPGVNRFGRWTATYVAVPTDGLAWRASFNAVNADTLRDVRIAVTEPGLPGGTGWQRLPAWLPQENTVWTADSAWLLPAMSLRALEPVGPLR